MSDDDVDHELLALLRKKFGLGDSNPNAPPETKVLQNAQFIYDNSIDVALSMAHTKLAAIAVLEEMQKREYSTKTWAEHELHPKAKDEATVNFIFTMDLLNFSFWSEKNNEERYTISYKGKKWTGYWSLVAALQRALDEGIPITSPKFWIMEEGESAEDEPNNRTARSADAAPSPWVDHEAPRLPNDAFDTGVYPEPVPEQPSTHDKPVVTQATEAQSLEPASHADDAASSNDSTAHVLTSKTPEDIQTPAGHLPLGEVSSDPEAQDETLVVERRCTESLLRHVFRSDTGEEIPMFEQRVHCLRQAGQILHEQFDGSVVTLIEDAKGSAAGLVNLLADRFPCFRDEATFEKQKVRFLKRAQIFVADLWASFEGERYGSFNDIDKITMFAGMCFDNLLKYKAANESDYRVPQILNSLGLVSYCPPLEARIRRGEVIPAGHSWELQIRGE